MLFHLQQYNIQMEYKKGAELYVADTLRRAYQEIEPNDILEEELEILMVLPILKDRLTQLQMETEKNRVLHRLKNYILNAWPKYKSAVHPTVQVCQRTYLQT